MRTIRVLLDLLVMTQDGLTSVSVPTVGSARIVNVSHLFN